MDILIVPSCKIFNLMQHTTTHGFVLLHYTVEHLAKDDVLTTSILFCLIQKHYILRFIPLLSTGKVITNYDGDTASPSTLQSGAVFNVIKSIQKNDVSPDKLIMHEQ